MAYRGLYGCPEGNERRTGSDSFGDHLADNNVVEGNEEKTLRAMFSNRLRWGQIDPYLAGLKQKGWSPARIQSVMTRAQSGVRV